MYKLSTLGAFCELSANENVTMGNALTGYDFAETARNDIYSTNHERQYFSTFDRDTDGYVGGNCALEDGSGWWFNRCSAVQGLAKSFLDFTRKKFSAKNN